ncbi:uncharacterized protein LOC124698176 isoform X1 [Lolium rigidum]|uniref:uncharacterized protein LOC124698176 isoform X1 n=1 Tax=Lolium rigidum TaxID=89674 RepID=UPI001F5CA73B|nr:uncharacterized protein LOC124698176 isoform X1 [Lolium rigidum]
MAELPTTEPEEEKLYAGNAEADVEICGGLDEHSQQQHPDSVLMELERAKSKLNRTTITGLVSQHLFEWKEHNSQPLEWKKRLSTALDVARGVEYLHSLAPSISGSVYQWRQDLY